MLKVPISGWPGSVRFGYGLGVERFERFRFSAPAVPLQKGVFCVSVQPSRKGRFRFRFRFLKNGSGGSGSAFGFGEKQFRRFRFPVPVWFLSRPAILLSRNFVVIAQAPTIVADKLTSEELGMRCVAAVQR